MKKELRIFLIILIGWILLLDFAILKTVTEKYIQKENAIIVNNLLSGAAVYFPSNDISLFQAVIVPLIIFNGLIILFLSIGYYFWVKSKSNLVINNKYSKKAQAAMEFMMTYGWAIMALVVSISALMYFGVINFSPTGNAICALSPGFSCEEFIVGNGGVVMGIRNNLGVDITSVSVNITNSKQGPCRESLPPKNLNDGEREDFFVACSNIQSLNEKFSGDIVIKYKKVGSVLEKSATGLLKGPVVDYNYNDTEAPYINLIEPIENQVYNSLLYNLIYTVDDYSSVTCSYSLDGGQNVNLPNCNSIYNLSSLTLGPHTLVIYASDTKNNSDSKTVHFTTQLGIDTEAPKWGNPGIEPHTVYQFSIITTRVDWTDNTELYKYGLFIRINSEPWRYYGNYLYPAGQSVNSSITYISISNTSIGATIYWKHDTYDIYGNYNVSDAFSFIVEPACQTECDPPQDNPPNPILP